MRSFSTYTSHTRAYTQINAPTVAIDLWSHVTASIFRRCLDRRDEVPHFLDADTNPCPAQICTHINTLTHTLTHSHTHIHTQTHTHSRSREMKRDNVRDSTEKGNWYVCVSVHACVRACVRVRNTNHTAHEIKSAYKAIHTLMQSETTHTIHRQSYLKYIARLCFRRVCLSVAGWNAGELEEKENRKKKAMTINGTWKEKNPTWQWTWTWNKYPQLF